MQVIKHPIIKVNKEMLWKYHEAIQEQIKPLSQWYELNNQIVLEIDGERQKIVRKYFRFMAGELMKDKKGEYILLQGMKMKDYDKEMEELMRGEVEIEDNGAIKWPVSIPLPEALKDDPKTDQPEATNELKIIE